MNDTDEPFEVVVSRNNEGVIFASGDLREQNVDAFEVELQWLIVELGRTLIVDL